VIAVEDRLLQNLGSRSISGGFVTSVSQGLKFVLSLGATVVLARLLAPQDFGLVAIVAAVIAFLNMFSDVGLTASTVQARTLTPCQSSNLFWINVCLSVLTGCVAAALAPGIGWFYHDPRLVSIGLVLALVLPVSGLAMQHLALLSRQMRFGTLAFIEVTSMLASAVVGCSMALRGWGYWSLVGMQVSAAAGTSALAIGASGWRPALPKRSEGTRPLLRFGLNLTAAGLVYRLARGCDTLLLGKFWGPHDVGLYTRASVLLSRPVEQFLAPISAVLLPALSRLQTQPERYRRAFLRAFDAVGLVSFPASALCLAAAHPVVMVLLGPRWEGVVRLYAGFTAAALYMPLAIAANWLFTSQGRGRELVKANVMLSTVTVLGFLVGLPYGALGMVLGFSLSGLLLRLPILYFLVGRSGPVRTADLWRVFFAHVPSWVTVYAATSLACALSSGRGPWIQLVACGLTSVTVAALTICVFSRQRRSAVEFVHALRAAFARHHQIEQG
jgi:O-antigen/teichoic acid export membrane protein